MSKRNIRKDGDKTVASQKQAVMTSFLVKRPESQQINAHSSPSKKRAATEPFSDEGKDTVTSKKPRILDPNGKYRKEARSSPNKPSSQDGAPLNKASIHTHGPHLTINEQTGDIFAAPRNAVLIHACNTQGSWGAGIAATFKSHYPASYDHYHKFCTSQPPGSDVTGSALLIPPLRDQRPKPGARGKIAECSHFVGCLFTSRGKGRTKDSPARILQNTGPAMQDLLRQVKEWNENRSCSVGGGADGAGDSGSDEAIGDLWMCRINSGLFGVPWEETKAVLEQIETDSEVSITVVERE
ncbi:hypothetical protein MBLNU459_g1898t1 [Dothideomycetes sp. NU459]